MTSDSRDAAQSLKFQNESNVYSLKPGEFSLQRWLEELPDDEIEREMNLLHEQIQTLTARYSTLQEARSLKQRFQCPRPSAEPSPRPSSISKGVLLVMASGEKSEWSVGDIYQALVNHGWIEYSNRSLRSLGAVLSRMYSDGEIRRIARGRYAQPFRETA